MENPNAPENQIDTGEKIEIQPTDGQKEYLQLIREDGLQSPDIILHDPTLDPAHDQYLDNYSVDEELLDDDVIEEELEDILEEDEDDLERDDKAFAEAPFEITPLGSSEENLMNFDNYPQESHQQINDFDQKIPDTQTTNEFNDRPRVESPQSTPQICSPLFDNRPNDLDTASQNDSSSSVSPGPSSGKSLTKNPKVKSFMDVLNEIYDENTEVPAKSNLGPKPWLMKNKPKPTASKAPLTPKSSNESWEEMKKAIKRDLTQPLPPPPPPVHTIPTNTPTPTNPPTPPPHAPPTTSHPASPPHTTPTPECADLYALPMKQKLPGRSRNPNSFPGEPTADNDTPSTSSAFTKTFPPKKQSPQKEEKSDKQTMSDLAKAAMQALNISSSALLEFEKKRTAVGRLQQPSMYDDVAAATPTPPKSTPNNVYDDILHDADSTGRPTFTDDANGRPASRKRRVISVPQFQPPPPPQRNSDGGTAHIYDSTPLEQKSIPNRTMEMMYSLFGDQEDKQQYLSNLQDARNQNAFKQSLENNSRPPSRVGSVYSEWSDCTLPDYPESLAGTRTQSINFDPTMSRLPNFQQPRFGQSNPNQQFPQQYGNDPMRNPRPQVPQPQFSNPQVRPNYPVIPINPKQAPPPQMYPLLGPNYEVHSFQQRPRMNEPYNMGPQNPAYNNPPQNFQGQYGNPNMGQPPNMGPQYMGNPQQPWGQSPNSNNNFDPVAMGHGRHHHSQSEQRVSRGRNHSRASSRGRSRERSHSRNRLRRRRNHSDSSSDGYESLTPSDEGEDENKAFLKGYKAALRDAVLTFAEQQQKKSTPSLSSALSLIRHPKPVEEADPTERLIRSLSSGRIKELAEDLELAAIAKKALAPRNTQRRQVVVEDDDYEEVDAKDLSHARMGRPLSRSGSVKSQRSNSAPRYFDEDDRYFEDRRESQRRGRPRDRSISAESCDCSECDDASVISDHPHHHHQQKPNREVSPRSMRLRKRYLDSMVRDDVEMGSSDPRATVRARHQDGHFHDQRFHRNAPTMDNRRYDQDERFEDQGPYYNDGGREGYRPNYPQKRGVRKEDDYSVYSDYSYNR